MPLFTNLKQMQLRTGTHREDWIGILEMARTRGLAIWPRPNLAPLPQIPWLLATLIDIMTFCLVPSIAASHARRSSSSSALDFAITVFSPLFSLRNGEIIQFLCQNVKTEKGNYGNWFRETVGERICFLVACMYIIAYPLGRETERKWDPKRSFGYLNTRK